MNSFLDGTFWMQHIKDLYARDTRLGGFRVGPRLTEAQINPNSFQEMSVRLVIQVKTDPV